MVKSISMMKAFSLTSNSTNVPSIRIGIELEKKTKFEIVLGLIVEQVLLRVELTKLTESQICLYEGVDFDV